MPWSQFFECWVLSQLSHSPLSLSRGSLIPLCFLSEGSVICISEVIDIYPNNLDSNLCFIQPSISRDALCCWLFTCSQKRPVHALSPSAPVFSSPRPGVSSSHPMFLIPLDIAYLPVYLRHMNSRPFRNRSQKRLPGISHVQLTWYSPCPGHLSARSSGALGPIEMGGPIVKSPTPYPIITWLPRPASSPLLPRPHPPASVPESRVSSCDLSPQGPPLSMPKPSRSDSTATSSPVPPHGSLSAPVSTGLGVVLSTPFKTSIVRF